jgi:hypothetical protein
LQREGQLVAQGPPCALGPLPRRCGQRLTADTFVADVICTATQRSPIVNGQTQFILPNDPPGNVVGPMPVPAKKP